MLAAPMEKIHAVIKDDADSLLGGCADLMTPEEQSVRCACFSR